MSAPILYDPQDLGKINAYFMEKEEDAVIRLRALEDRLAAIKAAPVGSSAAVVAATAVVPVPPGEVSGAGATDAPSSELEKLRSEVRCSWYCHVTMSGIACGMGCLFEQQLNRPCSHADTHCSAGSAPTTDG